MTVTKRVVKKSVKAVPVYTEEYVGHLLDALQTERDEKSNVVNNYMTLEGRLNDAEIAYNRLSMIHSETMLHNVNLRNSFKAVQQSITLKRWVKAKLWLVRDFWEARK